MCNVSAVVNECEVILIDNTGRKNDSFDITYNSPSVVSGIGDGPTERREI